MTTRHTIDVIEAYLTIVDALLADRRGDSASARRINWIRAGALMARAWPGQFTSPAILRAMEQEVQV